MDLSGLVAVHSQLQDIPVITQRIWGLFWFERMVSVTILVEEVLVSGQGTPTTGSGVEGAWMRL